MLKVNLTHQISNEPEKANPKIDNKDKELDSKKRQTDITTTNAKREFRAEILHTLSIKTNPPSKDTN